MALVVHGVLDADAVHELGTDGPDGDVTPDVVVHRDLAALVTPTEETEVLPTRAHLLRHTNVLERAAERTTVLPMRFGVVAGDADGLVADYLAPEHDAVRAQLGRLEGHVELRLRGTYDEDLVLREVLAADRRAARLRGRPGIEARMELGERVAAGIDALRGRDTGRAVDALGRHAADVAVGDVAGDYDAFAVSFLVGRDRLDDFDGAVARVGEDLAPLVRLELVGPLPPFSFAAPETQ